MECHTADVDRHSEEGQRDAPTDDTQLEGCINKIEFEVWRHQLSTHLCALKEEHEHVTLWLDNSVGEPGQQDQADECLQCPQNHKWNAEEWLLNADSYVHQDAGQHNDSHATGEVEHKLISDSMVVHEGIEGNDNDGKRQVDEGDAVSSRGVFSSSSLSLGSPFLRFSPHWHGYVIVVLVLILRLVSPVEVVSR